MIMAEPMMVKKRGKSWGGTWPRETHVSLEKQEQTDLHLMEEMRHPRYDKTLVLVAQQLAEESEQVATFQSYNCMGW